MISEERIKSKICDMYKMWFGKEPKDDAERREFERDLARIEILEEVLYEKQE